jgi:hypothetical protein
MTVSNEPFEVTMSDRADENPIADADVRRLLARAAELDATQGANSSRVRLREAAVEAGIGADAFDAAWRELHNDGAALTVPGHAQSSGVNPATLAVQSQAMPWWVKTSLWGVPDRKAAIGFYWIFTAVGLVSAVIAVSGQPRAFALSGLSLFSIWTTSQAVRWLDKHGWTLR